MNDVLIRYMDLGFTFADEKTNRRVNKNVKTRGIALVMMKKRKHIGLAFELGMVMGNLFETQNGEMLV